MGRQTWKLKHLFVIQIRKYSLLLGVLAHTTTLPQAVEFDFKVDQTKLGYTIQTDVNVENSDLDVGQFRLAQYRADVGSGNNNVMIR